MNVEMAPEVVAAGNKLVCNAELLQCEGACQKSGKCMRCCRHYGYTHGQCSMKHGQGCCCCASVGSAGEQQQRMLKVIPASPSPPARHPPLHA